MPIRRTCSFCGNELEPGTGKMFIRRDGTVFLFCSKKCERNLLRLRRVPRWTPWTQAYRRATAAAGPAVEEIVVPEAPPIGTAVPETEVTIEAPKGKDIPADLADLIDKCLGPDLPRAEIEGFYADFLTERAFRTSIVNWARKAHGGKAITRIGKDEFLAWKDTPEGRRVFKAWLDGQWQKVKGRRTEEAEDETPAPTAHQAKKEA